MEFKFKQKISKEEYLVFYKFNATKNLYTPTKILVGSVFLLTLYSGFFFNNSGLGFVGVALTVLFVAAYFRVMTSGGKIYEMDPETFHYTYDINDVTVSFSTKDGKSSKMWSEFKDRYEDDEFLFVFMKNNKGLMFVKSKMPAGLLSFIQQKVPKERKLNAIDKRLTKK